MRSLAIVVCTLCACVKSSSVTCSDESLCPESTVCDVTHHLCVTPGQVDACDDGQAPGSPCTADGITGVCTDGVCLAQECGDAIVEGSEQCDDGNQTDGDGCSANCLSNEQCGNTQIDIVNGEDCDDGNHLEHDGCSSICKAETPHWLLHMVAPPARAFPAVGAYPRRERIVLFGGGSFNETWEWVGIDWVRTTPKVSPTSRSLTTLAWDSDRDVMLMFGGRIGGQTLLADFWSYDGATWSDVDIAGTALPTSRSQHVMVYDPHRHRLVLFGGNDGGDTSHALGDTWEWDGDAKTWTQNMSPTHPSARFNASATYDPKAGVIVLVGGTDGTVKADTWTYDGAWHDVTSVPNPALYDTAMAYDLAGQRIVLFGGYNPATGLSNHTWIRNGGAWTDLGVIAGSPPPVSAWAMASTSTQLVAYGNNQGTAETWTFSTQNAWTKAPTLGTRYGIGTANEPLRGRALLYGGLTNGTSFLTDTWELTPTGLVARGGTSPQLKPQPNITLAYDQVAKNVVLLGTTAAGPNETWVWTGDAWAKKTPAAQPPPTGSMGIGFDGQSVTLLAGNPIAGGTSGDPWAWDGSTWNHGATIWTGGVTGVAATYDLIADRLVAFGGFLQFAGDQTDQTWTIDHGAAAQQAPGFTPAVRSRAGMAWNPARRRVTLACGDTVVVCDSFEWDGQHWKAIPATNPPPGRTGPGAITALDGGGVWMIGGLVNGGNGVYTDERQELRWDSGHTSERCDTRDLDGDGLVGCADPDCWPVCAPACPPGVTCDPNAPKCGDGICDANRESCSSCPTDCTTTCAPVCGDGYCDAGETCLGDCP